MSFSGKWVELEIILLAEINQIKTNIKFFSYVGI
jgi:hypothetical protein